MLRRSLARFGGGWSGGPAKGVVTFHEWHLREPEVVNYEGWRILDNVDFSLTAAWTYDAGGVGRHLDPIIDDPRLTHTQRVCRLYRWSLREMMHWLTFTHPEKFNLGYKVVRARFEKYRYVTDPAMCDMMIRETQSYLREVCSPAMLRQDGHYPGMPGHLREPMYHPDSCRVYDHWTHPEIYYYSDLKLQRYQTQHPNNSTVYATSDRHGNCEEIAFPWIYNKVFFPFMAIWTLLWMTGVMYIAIHDDDPRFDRLAQHTDLNLRRALEAEEKFDRGAGSEASAYNHDWGWILGRAPEAVGLNAYKKFERRTEDGKFWNEDHPVAPKKDPNFKFAFERDY